MQERSPGKLNRREFNELLLKGSLATIVAILLGHEVGQNSEQIIDSQTREFVFRILSNPPTNKIDFGIIADPRQPLDQLQARTDFVRQEVGRLDHIGLFHNLEHLVDQKGIQDLLRNFNFISAQGAIPYLALGCAIPPNGKHLLAPENLPWLDHSFRGLCEVIKLFGKPVVIRFLYETNVRTFGYSAGILGMSTKDQVSGFGKAAVLFDQIMKEQGVRELVSLMFNPVPFEPFTAYVTEKEVADVFDLYGMDIYDKSIFPQLFIGNTLISPGKESPWDLINGPIKDLKRISRGKQVVVGELGTQFHDKRWIQQLSLGLLAENITSFSFFDVDKTYERLLSEGDYRLSVELMSLLSGVLQFVLIAQEWGAHDDAAIKIVNILKTINIHVRKSEIESAR